jgi:hypothetical protein
MLSVAARADEVDAEWADPAVVDRELLVGLRGLRKVGRER